jgi:hypothetical protein
LTTAIVGILPRYLLGVPPSFGFAFNVLHVYVNKNSKIQKKMAVIRFIIDEKRQKAKATNPQLSSGISLRALRHCKPLDN